MSAFGLDLSDAWIRLALIEKRRNHLRLPVRGEIPVPPGAIVDGEIQNPKVVTDTVRRLLQAAGIRTRKAFVSLPERHTFIKTIILPKQESKPTDEVIRERSSQHLPFTLDDVYFDYHVVPRSRVALIGAAPKSLVDTYEKTLTAAGLEPCGFEIESLAIARATIPPSEREQTMIILDLGRTRSTLILIENEKVQFSATVRYAGKDLNQYIIDELHITEEQAERAKRIFGVDPDRGKGVLQKVLQPQIQSLADKIYEVQAYYHEHFPDPQPIQRIVLTGSGAMLRDIDRELSETAKIDVRLQPTWILDELRRRDSRLTPELGYIFATAFGLALLNTELRT